MIPLILFAYNRTDTLQRVLAAVQNQTKLPNKLIVFLDGARVPTDDGVTKVRKLLQNVDWLDIEVIERPKNLGSAGNIIDGLTTVFKSYAQAVIVEDDVLPAKCFYESMCLLLEHYASEPKVFSVGGFPSIKTNALPDYPFDVILSPRFSAWGWGTWANRWFLVQDHVRNFKNPFDDFANVPCHGGFNLESAVSKVEQNPGKYWDIPLALVCLNRGMFHALSKYYLAQNIGIDSGTHGNAGSLVTRFMAINNLVSDKIPEDFPNVQPQIEVCRAIEEYVAEIRIQSSLEQTTKARRIDYLLRGWAQFLSERPR